VTGTDTDTGVYYPAANQVALATNGTLVLIADASQNVGIGVTPSAWQAFSNLQVQQLTFSGGTAQGQISTNAYFNSGSYKYISNGGSARIFLEGSGSDGLVRFDTVVQGVANANLTYVERAKINTFGIGVGGATPTSGTGITFPAPQSASSNANTLDDYEEGTWTPTTPVGVSASTSTYQKIGNTVFLNTFINVNSNSNGASFIVTGLPFALIGGGSSSSVGCFSSTNTDLYAYMDSNGIYIRTNGNADRTCASLSGAFVAFQISYTT
jgi:hypothetical protein